MKKFQKSIVLLLVLAFVLTGCNVKKPNEVPPTGNEPVKQEEPVTLTVSAAASLTDCLEEIKAMYIEKNKHIDITYNFGASGSLQQQIEQGAPADIFFSAGKKQMTALKDAGLMVEDSIKDILENKVALIVPVNGKELKAVEELTGDDITKIAVGEPGSVPVGQYTDEILKDVREVLSWVETGNVEAGFVYQTDAQISDKVKISLTAPEGSHKAVIYPIGVVKSSQVTEAAQDFVDYLFGEEAKQVFTKYGFSPLS